MSALDIHFPGLVDAEGYELKKSKRHLGSWTLVPRGGRHLPINPIKHDPKLYLRFIEIEDDPEAHQTFVNTFGPITYRHHPNPQDDEDWEKHHETEETGTIYDHVLYVQSIVESWRLASRAASADIESSYSSNLNASLRLSETGDGLTLQLHPPRLFEAITLQLGQAISTGRSLRTCEWCSKLFEIGGAAKRVSSKFCSTPCRMAHHNRHRGAR